MKASLRDCAIGALLGSLAVVGTFGLLVLVGVVKVAPWVAMWQVLFETEAWVLPAIVGGLLFIGIGVLWGLPFALVDEPGPFKGFVYGVLPTLWAWTGMPIIMGGAPMGGLDPIQMGLPVVMNCVIWGTILGWYTREKVFGSGGGGGSVYY